ncbi:MAG: type II toxin-antitoxin system HigB family toxin [Isosphaeraceae bacterium]
MRVISFRRLREFWESRSGDQGLARNALGAWYRTVKSCSWANFSALRRTYPSADLVASCVAFNVGHNRYRVIGRVNFARGRVYVLKVMDHGEYDLKRWVDDCGCHRPPPRREKGKKEMAVKTAPVSYFRLVERFPLASIRDDAHLKKAQSLLDELLQLRTDRGTELYIDALTDLVEHYELSHEPPIHASEGDVLRELMAGHGLTQKALEAAVGISQSTISAVLNGTRSLTKDQVLALARYFGVGPSAFLAMPDDNVPAPAARRGGPKIVR